MRYEEPLMEMFMLKKDDVITTSNLTGIEGDGEVINPWEKL